MVVSLPDAKQQLLRQAQRACRGKAGYLPMTVLLLLDRGRAVAALAEDLGLDEATGYRYRQTDQLLGLTGYLRAGQSGCRGLLTSAQLASLRREPGQALYPDAGPLPTGWPAPTGSAAPFRA